MELTAKNKWVKNMLHSINENNITVQIDSLGAEVKSVVRNGTQYMWCGNPVFWAQTSPVLFPIVGRLKNGKYKIGKNEYDMKQHGFARRMEFRLVEKKRSSITFMLQSNAETLEEYPYCFCLYISYKLIKNTLMVEWCVENTGTTDMYFSIGAHPAFMCPPKTEIKEDCYLRFNSDSNIVYHRLKGGLIDKTKEYILPIRDGYVDITSGMFDNDALIVEGKQATEISLCRQDGSAYITVYTDAPLFGLWSPSGKNAPFICIEPWYGRCDSVDFDGELFEREYINRIAPSEIFERKYSMKFE